MSSDEVSLPPSLCPTDPSCALAADPRSPPPRQIPQLVEGAAADDVFEGAIGAHLSS